MRASRTRRVADRRGGGHRAPRQRSWSRLDPAAALPITFIVACLLFGGPLGALTPPFALLLLIGGALVVVAVARGWSDAFQTLPLAVRLAVAGWVALPFLQLVPLPPAWWRALPGAGLRLEVLSAFGLQHHWMPLSVSPIETAYCAAMALAMFGLLLAALHVGERTMRTFLATAAGVVLLGAAIGVIQFASGGSALQFYAAADHSALIGFFTNKNHMGLALACLAPLLHVLVARRGAIRGDVGGFVAISVALLSLIVATNSRAALLLGAIAIAATALSRYPERRRLVAVVLAALAAAAVLASLAIPSIGHLAERLGRSGDDVRGDFLAWSRPLASLYGPVGAGFGSFPDIFPPSEQLAWVKPTQLNAVHNDYLQLYIEGGIVGVAVLVWSLAVLAVVGARTIWAGVGTEAGAVTRRETDLAWMGGVIVVLFALHSVADYPARRAATLTLLVLAVACVLRPTARRRLPAC
ncbi:MAG TPA: O-antigen ligase family protein [Sphingomonas sp.]|jgi:hypothetical protein